MADATEATVSHLHPSIWVALGAAIVAFVKGFPAMVRSARDAYVAKLRNAETMARQDAERERGEREESVSFAIEERSERRELQRKIDGLTDKITELTGQVARCEAQHAESERDRAELREIVASLRTQVDMQSQLVDRQREQINELVKRLMEGAA